MTPHELRCAALGPALAAAALLAAGCAAPAPVAAPAAPPSAPRYAVLPFDNLTDDPDAAALTRDLVRIALFKRGYDVMGTTQVDALLKTQAGDASAKRLQGLPPSALAAALGANRLVYGYVDEFGLSAGGKKRKVSVGVRIKRAPDGAAIFVKATELETSAAGEPVFVAPAKRAAAGTPSAGRLHPLRSLAAAAVAKCLQSLPFVPPSLPVFGRTQDQVAPGELCVALATLHPWLAAWAGTEADPLLESPVCYAPTSFKKVDDFLQNAAAFTAQARLAATTAYLQKRGVATASNGDPVSQLGRALITWLGPSLQGAPDLVQNGILLSDSTPRKAKGQTSARLAAVKSQIDRTVKDLEPTIALAKTALADLSARNPAAAPAPVPAPEPPPVVSTGPLPDSYDQHLDLARGYDSVPDPAKAASEYRAALAAAPGQLEAQLGLAKNLLALQDYKAAEAQWSALMPQLGANDPRRGSVLERLAAVRVREGDLSGAKAYYLQALTFDKRVGVTDKSRLNAYLGLAYILAKRGERDDAVRNYKKAYTLTSNAKTRAAVEEALDGLNATP